MFVVSSKTRLTPRQLRAILADTPAVRAGLELVYALGCRSDAALDAGFRLHLDAGFRPHTVTSR